ncbi:hypothetical protein ACFQ6Q_08020 [Streptomyces sp. NPDC056437]|uniref:hypothetical protein n=1 Tax=Streptomyces sp. NPDC056437 TaxID=3345816 RepID=UPI0036B84BF3
MTAHEQDSRLAAHEPLPVGEGVQALGGQSFCGQSFCGHDHVGSDAGVFGETDV